MPATPGQRKAFYPGRAPIDAYGNGGFRFAQMSHKGSLLCLPSGIYGLELARIEALALDHLAPVFSERSALEFLLLGTGLSLSPPPSHIRQAFADAGLGLEVMDTGAAARTYNVLLAEGRAFGAALVAVD